MSDSGDSTVRSAANTKDDPLFSLFSPGKTKRSHHPGIVDAQRDVLDEDDEDDEDFFGDLGSPGQDERKHSITMLSRGSSGDVEVTDRIKEAQDTVKEMATLLAVRPANLRKGRSLAQVVGNGDLEISFVLQFQVLPEASQAPALGDMNWLHEESQLDVVSIMHFTLDGNLATHWPSMRAAVRFRNEEEWLEIITYVKHGGALLHVQHVIHDMDAAMKPMPVRVVLRCSSAGGPQAKQVYLQSTIRGEAKEDKREFYSSEVLVPEEVRMHCFFSSPVSVPAIAQIHSAELKTQFLELHARTARQQHDLILPPRVQELHMQQEAQEKMMLFDMSFGVLVIINGVWIGIEVSSNMSTLVETIVNNLFLAIFALELVLRYKMSSIQLRVFLQDPWIFLDILIVIAGAYDAWLTAYLESPFPPTVLRLARLLRLGRMVRILKLFRALGLLVDTMLSATQVVLWTLLLLMILVYAAGILMVRVSEFTASRIGDDSTSDGGKSKQQIALDDWSTVPASMWSLMQMVTGSGWADYIRRMAFDVGGIDGFAMSIVLVGVMIIGTLGLMNMVIALLCRTAFSLHRRQREMHAATLLAYKKTLMPRLRTLLGKHLSENSFGRSVGIGTEELLELYDESDQLRKVLTDLDVGKSDILAFGLVFEDEGELDLEAVYEVIGAMQLELFFKAAEAQKFLFGAELLGTLRTADMLAYNKSMKLLEEDMHAANRHSMGICTMLHNLNDSLIELMNDASTHVHVNVGTSKWRERSTVVARNSAAPIRQDSTAMRHTWDEYIKGTDMDNAEALLTIRIDISAAVVILANALLMGMQVENDQWNLLWLDSLFTLVFILEFCLRATLFTHLQNLYEDTAEESPAAVVLAFRRLRSRMILGILPPRAPEGVREVILNLPQMLKDKMALFDLLIIVICLLDNVTAAIIGGSSENFSSVGAFRVLRLLRLSIIFKVLHVFPRLQMLLDAMVWTRGVIFWITFYLLVVIYAFSSCVMLVVLERDGDSSDPTIRANFGSIYNAMVSGWRLITFDEWGSIIESVMIKFPGAVILIGMLIGVGGLSAMNIATAVMAEAAVRFTKLFAKKEQVVSLQKFWANMIALETIVVEKLGCPILSVDVIEAATGIKIAKRQSWEEDGPKFDATINDALQEAALLVEDNVFIEQLQLIFYEADLQPEFVKLIFERSDREAHGYVSVDEFSQAALCTKTDVIKLDMLLSNICLRSLRQLCADVTQVTHQCQQLAGHVVEQAATLIHRRAPVERKNGEANGHILPHRLAKVIDDLNSWRDDGVLPFIKGSGSLEVVRGTGKITFNTGGVSLLKQETLRQDPINRIAPPVGRNGLALRDKSSASETVDRCKGEGTAFFDEIAIGDYLLVQEPVTLQLVPVLVLSIQSNTHLRCTPSTKVSSVEGARFMIGKRKRVGHPRELSLAASHGHHLNHHHHHRDAYDAHRAEGVTPTVDLNGLLTSSPRSSRAFMTWELESRKQMSGKVLKLKKERRALTAQFEKLVYEIADLHQKDTLEEVINSWKAFTTEMKRRVNGSGMRLGWMNRHLNRSTEQLPPDPLMTMVHEPLVEPLPNPLAFPSAPDLVGLQLPRVAPQMLPTPAGMREFKHAGPRMPSHHAAAQPPPLTMSEDLDMPDAGTGIPREGPRERPKSVGVGVRIGGIAACGVPRQLEVQPPPGTSTPRMGMSPGSAVPSRVVPLRPGSPPGTLNSSVSPSTVPTAFAGERGVPRAKANIRAPQYSTV